MSASSPAAARTIIGHPPGLFVLFFAEMWERFSYYGMRALLILYLTKHFLFADDRAYIVYGAYTSLVYITPIIGGYLADRWLGQRKAVLYGAVLLTIGHFLMGFEGKGGQDATFLAFFYLALSFIIVGSGFLKANISVIVGALYERDDPRRDPAFTIFYIGINLGAALGALLCGFMGETFGWAYGFGLAGFGMLAGLAVFAFFRPALQGRGEPANPDLLVEKVGGISREWLIYAGGVLGVMATWQLIQHPNLVGGLLGVAGGGLVLYLLFVSITELTPVERNRIIAVLLLMVLSILFWALFEQAGSSLNLYVDRSVDRSILGFEVPTSVFQSLNAIYIIVLAPFFAMLWTWLGQRGLEPSAPAKFGLGLMQLGAGFLVLVAGDTASGGAGTSVIFVFLIYLLHTTGELCLSPVGLSAVTRLAPAHLAGLLMGAWFFATAGGNFTAGLIARATEGSGGGGIAVVYTKVGTFAVIVGIVSILGAPLIRRLMHGDVPVAEQVEADIAH
ncbi:MAG: peptide MFS transporter [Acetobacteraceae bacterium]